jgi:hypothetical protein
VHAGLLEVAMVCCSEAGNADPIWSRILYSSCSVPCADAVFLSSSVAVAGRASEASCPAAVACRSNASSSCSPARDTSSVLVRVAAFVSFRCDWTSA